MGGRVPTALANDMADGRRQFDAWRRRRTRGRIPDALWALAVRLERYEATPATAMIAYNRFVHSRPLDNDGLHFGPTAGIPSLRPYGRPRGKLDGIAVLGRVDRLRDGFRRQASSRAGLGMNILGQ